MADAIVSNTETMWTDVAVFLHPDNDSVRVLPETVGEHADAVVAINQLLPNDPIAVVDPYKLVELVTTHSREWDDWATYITQRYLLSPQ